jgi:hypothetical protein
MADSIDTSILQTIVLSNRADNGGGGIYDAGNDYVSILHSNISFNLADSSGSGTFSSGSGFVDIRGTTFSGNCANDSGTTFIDNAHDAFVASCMYDGNVAVSSGGGVFVTSTLAIHLENNSFVGNRAMRSAGGAVFYVSSTMEEPQGLLTTNSYDGNTAVYGDNVATEGYRLSVGELTEPQFTAAMIGQEEALMQMSRDDIRTTLSETIVVYYNVTDYSTSIDPIPIYLQDYYGQTVVTDSETVLQVSVSTEYSTYESCYDGAGYVSGGIFQSLEKGIANFSSLLCFCAPEYDIVLDATGRTTEYAASVATSFGLTFRSCKRGEYYADKSCLICEEGSYSLEDDVPLSANKLCRKCPQEASRCYGDIIEADKGYWRVSIDASTLLRCPLGAKACTGGAVAGKDLCAAGYEVSII